MISSSNSAAVVMLSLFIGVSFISTARGCAPMPPGQGRTVRFNVSDFTLPAAMAYSAGVQAQVPSVAKSGTAAMTLVRNLIMEAVTAVLEEQGRNALLPSFVVSAILDQLTVTVTYDPLQCPKAYTTTAKQANGAAGECFIIGNIVTILCGGPDCDPPMGMVVNAIPPQHLSISGSVTTSNLIMAGWSSQMWRSVFNRALGMLRSGPFGTNFGGAVVTIM